MKRADLPPPEFHDKLQNVRRRAEDLSKPTRIDPNSERLANHLRKRCHWLFTFLEYPQIEATNDRAERALCPTVIA